MYAARWEACSKRPSVSAFSRVSLSAMAMAEVTSVFLSQLKRACFSS